MKHDLCSIDQQHQHSIRIFQVSAWGGYVFVINLIPIHVLLLLILQRYSLRLYVSYSTFYILGLILSMQIPFVGFQPVRTSEHVLAAGVFALLHVYATIDYLYTKQVRLKEFPMLLYSLMFITCLVGLTAINLLVYTGCIAPWSGRFYSLWDVTYAERFMPLIDSVSEHQPPIWSSFFLGRIHRTIYSSRDNVDLIE
jgi:dolichyl-diphosphooligosaccharide---protein glycosyltransferase